MTYGIFIVAKLGVISIFVGRQICAVYRVFCSVCSIALHGVKSANYICHIKTSFVRKLAATIAFSFCIVLTSLAQAPAGQPGGQPGAKGAPAGPGAPGARQAPPSIGRAYGKVTDSTGQPIQATAVVLKSTVDPTTKKKKLVLMK